MPPSYSLQAVSRRTAAARPARASAQHARGGRPGSAGRKGAAAGCVVANGSRHRAWARTRRRNSEATRDLSRSLPGRRCAHAPPPFVSSLPSRPSHAFKAFSIRRHRRQCSARTEDDTQSCRHAPPPAHPLSRPPPAPTVGEAPSKNRRNNGRRNCSAHCANTHTHAHTQMRRRSRALPQEAKPRRKMICTRGGRRGAGDTQRWAGLDHRPSEAHTPQHYPCPHPRQRAPLQRSRGRSAAAHLRGVRG